MKHTINLLLIVAVIIVASCQSGDKTADSGEKHFRHLKFSETPFDQISGLHEISAEEAESINNYKFTYSEEGQLISVEYCRGDVLLRGSQTGAAKVGITYQGNKEIHNYYNIHGEPAERWGIYSAEYELDDNGMRTGMRFLDKEGNPAENRNGIAWFEWEILSSGQLKENRYNLEGEETVLNEFCPFYELRFTYDDEGFVTNMANYQGDSMYNCTVENCGDIGVSYFAFEYNDAGDITKFTVSSLTGQLSNLYWGWAKFENKYDENGNALERAMYDQDNEPLGGMSIPVTQMVYDDHGSLVEIKFMDPDRNLMDHPRSGVALSKYLYDESGHPVDTLKYNAQMVEM